MRHIEVIGNVMTAFYPEEKDSTMTRFNNMEGSVLHLYMKEKKMEKGMFVGKSNGCLLYTSKESSLVNCWMKWKQSFTPELN